jgi:sigma-E factor negative regulatory protein RseA
MNFDKNLKLSDIERAQISDLADGRLRGVAFTDALDLLESSSTARAAWHGLHAAGDVLRGETSVNPVIVTNDMAFLDTFRANLAKEPRLTPKLSPELTPKLSPKLTPEFSTVTFTPPKLAANDPIFNWKWLGGLSAAAAVVALSWNVVSTNTAVPNVPGATLARSEPTPPQSTQLASTQTAAGVMMRSPQLDALIAAHNQVGGSSALQRPSGFLRSATFQGLGSDEK